MSAVLAPPAAPARVLPLAVVDLQMAAGAALVDARWRTADAAVREIAFVEVGHPDDPLGPGVVPNRTYDIEPHAEAVDFDDSGWRALAPEETQLRLGTGRVCFTWYRTRVTLPERIGDVDVAGTTVVFEVVVDDYAEVWVDGALPHELGDAGGPVVAGFNAPNRVVLTRDARPGQAFTIAVFGINGPISTSPRNYVWMRSATLDVLPTRGFEAVEPVVTGDVPALTCERVASGFVFTEGPLWRDGALLFSSPNTNEVFRWTPGGRSRSTGPRAATPEPTSAATRSRGPTAWRSTPRAGCCCASTATAACCASTRTATPP